MKQLILLLLFGLFVSSCNKSNTFQMKLKELDGFVIEASPNTYLLTIEAKGKTDCPVDISLIKDGKKFGSPYKLDGEIDTFFRRDWTKVKLASKLVQYLVLAI